jgi:putative addiction module component (TIGR02574 family)
MQVMSKVELLEEISKLTPDERDEIWNALWTLEERHMLGANAPSDEEKAMLDREMEDFEKNPWAGTPWDKVEARLRRGV